MAKHSIFEGVAPPEASNAAEKPTAGTVAKTAKPSKGEAELIKTSTYFSRAVHEKLRELAFNERVSINDLVIEGLDRVLKDRRFPTTRELTEQARQRATGTE